jgi:hypothetical protein
MLELAIIEDVAVVEAIIDDEASIIDELAIIEDDAIIEEEAVMSMLELAIGIVIGIDIGMFVDEDESAAVPDIPITLSAERRTTPLFAAMSEG